MLSSEPDFYTDSETNLEVIKINLRTLIGSSLCLRDGAGRAAVLNAD